MRGQLSGSNLTRRQGAFGHGYVGQARGQTIANHVKLHARRLDGLAQTVNRPAAAPGDQQVDRAEPASLTAIDVPQHHLSAVVWDHAGGTIGLGAAEALVAQGCRVHVVTPAFAVAEDVDVVQRVPLYERLLAAGTVFVANADVIALDGAEVVTRNVYSGEESRIGPVDLLVAWRGNRALDALRGAIEAAGLELHMVGDCVAPRSADVAMAEGALAARAI